MSLKMVKTNVDQKGKALDMYVDNSETDDQRPTTDDQLAIPIGCPHGIGKAHRDSS